MKFLKATIGLGMLGMLALPAATPPVSAADLRVPQEQQSQEMLIDERIESAWSVSVAPLYGWIPGMKGDMAVLGQDPVSIDVTPIDIIKNLDELLDVLEGIYFGNGHIRYNKVGFMWDAVYLDIASTNEIDRTLVSGALDVGFALTMATLTGTYRIYDEPTASVDLVAGARVTEVDLQVGLDLNVGALSSSDGDTWVDPIVGVRGRKQLSERTYLDGWAMVGGFGVESDLIWDLYGVFGYEIRDWVSAYAGFRAAGTDYKDGAFVWDLTMYGPIVGFELNF